MRRVRTWSVPVVALLGFLAAAGPSAAQVVRSTEVSERQRDRTLGFGELAAFDVSCPARSVVTSGALISRSANATVLRSSPLSRRAWRFAFRNSASSATADVKTKVTCLRLRAPRIARPVVSLGASAISAPTPVLGRNETLGLGVRCPRGQRAVGYGARLAGLPAGGGARPSGLGAVGGIQILQAMPTGRGLVLVMRNLGPPGAARVYARCLARVARAGSRGRSRPRYRRSVILPLRSFPESVGPRRAERFSHGCGRFRLALGAWHAIPRERNVFLLSSFPTVAFGGSWTLLSFEPASTPVTLALRCVDVRSAWVRVR